MSTPLNVYFGKIYLEHFSKIQELRNELKANRPKPKKYKKPSENILALKKSNIQNFSAFRPISPGERRRSSSPMMASKLRLQNLAKDLEFQHQSKCFSPVREDCNDSTFSLEDFQTPKRKVMSRSFVDEMIPSLDVSRISKDPNNSSILNSPVEFMDSSGVLKIEANEKTQMFIIDLSRTTQGFIACSARKFQTVSVQEFSYTPLSKPKYTPVYLKQVHYFKIPSLDLSFGAASKPDLRQCRNHLGDSLVEFDATISSMSKTPLELADTLHYTQAPQPDVIKSILIEANIAPKTPDSSPSEVEFDSSVDMVESLRNSLDRRLNKSYTFVMDPAEYKQLEIITSEDSEICTSRFSYDCKENSQLAAIQPQFPVYSVSRELEYVPGEYIQQQSDTISPTLEINLGFSRPFSTFNPIEISQPVLISDSFCAVNSSRNERFSSCKSGSSLQTELTPPPSCSESNERLDSYPDFHFDSGSPLITELEAADENAKNKKLQAEAFEEMKSFASSPEERLLTLTDNLLSPDEELSPTFTYNYSDGSETVANDTHPTCTLRSNYTEREAFHRQYDCFPSETHREVETEPDLATDSIVVYDYFSINPRPVEHDFSSSCSNVGKDDIIVIDTKFMNEMSSPEEVKRYIEDVMDEVLVMSQLKERNSRQEVSLDEVEEEYTQEEREVEKEMQFGEVLGHVEKESEVRVSYSLSDDGKISYKNSEEDRVSYKFSEEDLISDKFDKYENMMYRTSDERLSNKTSEEERVSYKTSEEEINEKDTEYEEISKINYQKVYENSDKYEKLAYKSSEEDRFSYDLSDDESSAPLNKESDKSSEDEISSKSSNIDSDRDRHQDQRLSDYPDYINISRESEKGSFREERTSEKGVSTEESSHNPFSSNSITHFSSTPKHVRLNITPNVASIAIFSKDISFTRMDSFTSEEMLPVTSAKSYSPDAETSLISDLREYEVFKTIESKIETFEVEIDHEVLPRNSSPVKIHPALIDLDLLELNGDYERYQPQQVEGSNSHKISEDLIDLQDAYERYQPNVMQVLENNEIDKQEIKDLDLIELEQPRDIDQHSMIDMVESRESLYISPGLKLELIQIQNSIEMSQSSRSSVTSSNTNIQSVMRGYLSRQLFHDIEHQQEQAIIQSHSVIRGYLSRRSFHEFEHKQEQALIQSHSAIRGYISRRSFHEIEHKQEQALIQSHSAIRGYLSRRSFHEIEHKQEQALIQSHSAIRGYLSRRSFHDIESHREHAIIQSHSAIRGYISRKLFHDIESHREQALIQSHSVMRGYLSRRFFHDINLQQEQALIQSHSVMRGYLYRRFFHDIKLQQEQALIQSHSVVRGYLSRRSFHNIESQREQVLIQSHSVVRGYLSRRSFHDIQTQQEQYLLQSHSVIRGYLSRRSFQDIRIQQHQFILSKLSQISHRLIISTAKSRILKAITHYLQSKHLQSELKFQSHYCTVIQRHFRGYLSRKHFRPIIHQRLSAKIKILAMVSGWKVRRIVDTHALYSQRQQIQDMYAILKLSLSKPDSSQELIRSIYSELPNLKLRYMNEIQYNYSTGSWIYLERKTKRWHKATPEPRLMEHKDEIEDVDMNGSGYLSVKQDHELGDISSQNILDAVNRTMSFEPLNSDRNSPQPDISKLSFDSFDVNVKQPRLKKKPIGLRLNLEEIMRNQREVVSYPKPIEKQPIKKPSPPVPQKHVPRHAYITLPLISSESEESFRDTKPIKQEIDKRLFSESSLSIANLSSVASDPTIPYLTCKSTIKSPLSILHNPTFTPKPEPKFLKIKCQPKQNQRRKVAKIDIRKLPQSTDLYTPSIASIKPIESLSVSELEMIFKDLRRNHITSEEYFLQSSRVVSKSAIPQYRLNSLFFKDRF